MLKGTNFAYLNFDDRQLLDLWNEDLVMTLLDDVYSGYDFLLLDEVQNLAGWDLWVKQKLMLRAAQKVYVVDNGLVGASAFNVSENLGRLLENQVFIELLRRGYEAGKTLFYYRSRNDKEVDFVARRGVRVKMLIQVCYEMSSAKTRKRETESLTECAGELKCDNLFIATNDTTETIERDGYVIKVVAVSDF